MKRRPRPVARKNRTRRLVLPIGVAAGAMVMSLAPAAAGAAGESAPPEEPEITFTDLDQRPLSCGSGPSVSSIRIHRRDRLTVINATGYDATLAVDLREEGNIPDGDGASLRLKHGQHAIWLIPDCGPALSVPLVVTVTTGEGPDRSPAPSDGSPQPEHRSGATAPRAGGSPAAPATPGNGPRPRLQTASGSGPLPGSETAPTAGSAVDSIVPIPGGRSDRHRSRLLAIIAAICVFGVSSAVIRAILSQSSPNVANPLRQ